MNEQAFLHECDRVLTLIENRLDGADLDADTERSGQVLTIELEDGSKVIVNGNAPVREIWVAARSGGFHFRQQAGRWLDTRSGEELFASLSACLTRQAGRPVDLGAAS